MIEQEVDKVDEVELPETTYVEGFLFHGANKKVNFDPFFDYNNLENTAGASATLGEGLYLTNDPIIAANYSKNRKASVDKEPTIHSVYAPDCKFLDFRGTNGKNVNVPTDIVQKWLNFCRHRLEKDIQHAASFPESIKTENSSDQPIVRYKISWKQREIKNTVFYLGMLEQIISSKIPISLREMLGVDKIDPNLINTEYKNRYSPLWISDFREFVVNILNYDGIIYREGAEKTYEVGGYTFVIYNLESITFSRTPLEQKVINSLVGK